jgi:hypothetical protein
MTTPKKVMPKGGRKGGTIFPRVALKEAVDYARKLVSKTHTGAQPRDVIFSGVVGAKSGLGDVRISALKQYGFLKGDTKSNFSADDLAKKIVAAPPEELVQLYRQAVLRPTVFKRLFDTFHGDTVSKAKLKQRAADLKVHPDETTTCVDLYISGMSMGQLVSVDGDQVEHLASSDIEGSSLPKAERDIGGSTGDDGSADQVLNHSEEGVDEIGGWVISPAKGEEANAMRSKEIEQSAPRAVFNVNVTLDSSLDIEKLQKQLELLKRFGAI